MGTRDNGRNEILLHVKGQHGPGPFVAGVVYHGNKVVGCAPYLAARGFWTMTLEEAIQRCIKNGWKYRISA